MAKIYANQLIKGNISWDDIVDRMKDAVLTILRENVQRGILAAEQYEQITGQPYTE